MTPEERATRRAEVKTALARLQAQAPGHAVELRVPPFAAVQLIEGPRHTRGTPSAVVEMSADTLFGLIDGSVRWADSIADGRIRASGERSDLSALFA